MVSDPDLQRILTLLLSDAELVAKDFNERSGLVSGSASGWSLNNCCACGVSCAEGQICSGGACSSNIFSESFTQGQDSSAQCSR